jgi:hypothetical protein
MNKSIGVIGLALFAWSCSGAAPESGGSLLESDPASGRADGMCPTAVLPGRVGDGSGLLLKSGGAWNLYLWTSSSPGHEHVLGMQVQGPPMGEPQSPAAYEFDVDVDTDAFVEGNQLLASAQTIPRAAVDTVVQMTIDRGCRGRAANALLHCSAAFVFAAYCPLNSLQACAERSSGPGWNSAPDCYKDLVQLLSAPR